MQIIKKRTEMVITILSTECVSKLVFFSFAKCFLFFAWQQNYRLRYYHELLQKYINLIKVTSEIMSLVSIEFSTDFTTKQFLS